MPESLAFRSGRDAGSQSQPVRRTPIRFLHPLQDEQSHLSRRALDARAHVNTSFSFPGVFLTVQALPLLKRAAGDDGTFVMTPVPRVGATATEERGRPVSLLRMPARTPGPGEQYRFHFDMSRCIGCKCCVVACNEQNGNPPAINWRRVGEIEGGYYPHTSKVYLSMGCNHCLDPTCLRGCPVDAYTKDPATGIVTHSADACIGCQYCTWNCSYGVPQYNPERGVVGKCDMCHGRLELGQTPACVSACPEGAIEIEIVAADAWRQQIAASAGADGLPIDDGSLGTTRITLPAELPPDTGPLGSRRLAPEHAHWSLILMTVLTQLSVGTFVTIWLLQVAGLATGLGSAALTSLLVAALALNGATLHLGRPAHAYRALRMWRRSWLSREVLLFTAFSGAATVYAGLLWFEAPWSAAAGALTAALGVAGVTASGWIYRVPSRPAWNSPLTPLQFNLTAACLGPLLAAALGATSPRLLAVAAVSMSGAQLVVVAVRFAVWIAAGSIELQGTARLLATTFRSQFIARGVLLALGGIVLPLVATGAPAWWAALATAIAAETLGRYLFFVSVVPKHLAAPYLQIGSEAA